MTDTMTTNSVSDESVTSQATPQVTETTATNITPVQSFTIPDEYKDKAWAKNIKSEQDLYKSYDNAQSLIGKKTIGLPDWNDDKQVEDYYNKIRPESYELDGVDESEKGAYSELFKKSGLSQKQVNTILSEFKGIVEPKIEANYGAKSLEKILTEEFKDKEMLRQMSKEAVDIFGKEFFDSQEVSNNAIVQIYKGLAKIKQQYGVNELNANVSAEHGSTNMTIAELDSKIDALHSEIFALNGKMGASEQKANKIKEYNDLILKRSRSK